MKQYTYPESTEKTTTIGVQIIPNDRSGTPTGKLADAELWIEGGPFDGLKLIGFGIWERRGGAANGRNVTFPARQYSVNGERRSFALLRPTQDSTQQDAIRDLILRAYADFETEHGSSVAGTGEKW